MNASATKQAPPPPAPAGAVSPANRASAEAGDRLTLGIIGGGQLARMTAQAAAQFGIPVVIQERQPEFPAAHLAPQTVIGDWNDPESLLALAALVDVVTLENEFVEAGALQVLEQRGHKLWPSSATMRLVQDKLIQKKTLAAAGLPVPRLASGPSRAAIREAAERLGWPLVLKRRTLGYDGKGNATVPTAADLDRAWRHLEGDRHALYVEEFCPFTTELAVILTRGQDGDTAVYPVTETINRDHICHVTQTPAPVSPESADQAALLARKAAAAVGIVGSMGLELFLRADGTLLINELAPRVHNTGHYSIEACECSQFENHVRAVLGLPLGSTAMRAPAAVMVNLLANADGPGTPHSLAEAVRVSGAHVHLYGKTRAARGRKMGHVTALGRALHEALATAQRAAQFIHFG